MADSKEKYINEKKEAAYLRLYEEVKKSILEGSLKEGSRLPSKRLLSEQRGVSVITAAHALQLLEDEGYIEARQRSGCYVIYKEEDGFSEESGLPLQTEDEPFFPDEQEPASQEEIPAFPFSVYAKTARRVLSEYGSELMIKTSNSGSLRLRTAISDYLKRNRRIMAEPEQIVIGAGAEYLYGILVHILGRDRCYAIEEPSYEKIFQVYRANDVRLEHLPLGPDGILSSALKHSKADVLHISPYRSYPSGVTASAAKRREYIRWAQSAHHRFIIEDDFESEFTPSTKPEETVFALSDGKKAIYLNTFSKTIAPSVRAGYMVLPAELLDVYKKQAGFYSCAVPAFEQYVLAEFISGGDFERHINRVRRARRKNQRYR